MLISDAEAALDAFFEDSSRKVLFLKGPWGAGKSYFVRGYLSTAQSKAPSYQHFVSLFGLSSLNEVKETINACLEIRVSSKTANTLQKYVKGIANVAKNVKKLTDEVAPKWLASATDFASAVGSSWFWGHVKARESVIVFDDLERSSLPIDHILGLASNLAENSKAKILVICNEDELSEERLKLLNVYREKLFDIEILFKPALPEIVGKYLVFQDLVPGIIDLFQSISSNNIRLLSKINSHLKLLSGMMRAEKIPVTNEELIHAAKIVCLRYLSKKSIRSGSLHDIIFAGIFSSRNKEATDEEKECSELSSKLKLFPGTIFDDVSLEILQNGYLSDSSLETFRKKCKENSDRGQYDQDVRKAYASYGDNFSATVADVIRDIKQFLNEYSDKIQTSEINSHFKFLKNVGYKGSLTPWVVKHLNLIDRIVDPLDRVNTAGALPSSTVTKRYIAKTLKVIPPISNPLELIRKINKEHSWNEKDSQALNGMTRNQVRQLVCGVEKDQIDQIRAIHKTWRGNNGPAGEFVQKIDAALAILKKRSKLNALRINNLFRAD